MFLISFSGYMEVLRTLKTPAETNGSPPKARNSKLPRHPPEEEEEEEKILSRQGGEEEGVERITTTITTTMETRDRKKTERKEDGRGRDGGLKGLKETDDHYRG